MYTKQLFKDNDPYYGLVNAEKLNHIEDGIVELENKIIIKNEYQYELLMKNATFENNQLVSSYADGYIHGHSLLNNIIIGDSYLISYDNGVNKYEFNGQGVNRFNGACISVEDNSITGTENGHVNINSDTEYHLCIPNSIYNERNGEVKVTILHKVGDEKILVKEDNTPVTKSLILDSTIDYSNLPFKGDEVLQAILDGRQVLVKVPNISGEGSLYVNYMPVFQYQLPANNNDFLTLLFMKDGLDTNLVTALGAMMQGGAADLSTVYGQLTLKLSKAYTETPLK